MITSRVEGICSQYWIPFGDNRTYAIYAYFELTRRRGTIIMYVSHNKPQSRISICKLLFKCYLKTGRKR